MPFPICQEHAFKTYTSVREMIWGCESATEDDRILITSEPTEESRKRAAALRAQRLTNPPQVYYARIGGVIKIGYSADVGRRMADLRTDREAVLATEPGGRELESLRHAQFRHLRIGRREDFHPEPELMSHIAMLVDHFGPPTLSRYAA